MGNIARFCVTDINEKFYLYDWNRLEIYQIGQEMYNLLLHTEKMEKEELIDRVLESSIEYKEDIIELINEERLFYNDKEKLADHIEHPSCLNIMCGVGYSCNLDCLYCLLKEREDNLEKTKDTCIVPNIIRVIETLYKNYNEIKIIITDGGEPFLFRDKIIELIEEIDKVDIEKKISITITTNGTIYDPKLLKILSNHNANIVFSLEGHMDNNHIRKSKNGIDNYALCIENYAKFLDTIESGITKNIWVTSIVNAQSKSVVTSLIDLYNIGFRTIQFRIVKGMKNSVGINSQNLDHFFKIYDELFRFFIENIDNDEDKYIRAILNNGDFIGQLFVPILLGEPKVKHCLGTFSTISIDKNGKMFPCAFLNSEINEEIQSFNYDDKIVRKYHDLDIDKIEMCSRCWASTSCGGHCVYQSFKSGNKYDVPDESMCKLIKYVLKNIIYLIDYVEENNPMMYERIYNFAKKRTYLYDILH